MPRAKKVKNDSIKSFSKVESLKTKVENTQKQIEKLKNQLTKDGEKLFELSCKNIFEVHKDFDSFAWPQYTMHWNDGDATNFYVYKENIFINDEDESQELHELEQLHTQLKNKDKSIAKLEKEIKELEKSENNSWKINSNKEIIKKIQSSNLEEVEKRYLFLRDVIDLLDSINDETFERMFGDHAKVIVSRSGTSVESYEHD